MTALRPVIPGTPESTVADHKQCGSLTATPVAHTLGVDVTVTAPDAATADQLVTAITAASPRLTARAVFGPPSHFAAAAFAAGEYLIVGVYCTGDARPVPKAQAVATHWVAQWSTDDDYYNCWLARQERTNLDAAYGGFGNVIVGAVGVMPTQTENEMALVRNGNGSVGAFARAPNGHIYHWWNDAAGWHGPEDVTAHGSPQLVIAGEPGAAATGGSDDVTVGFRAAGDGKLYALWKLGGQWHGPLQLPNQ